MTPSPGAGRVTGAAVLLGGILGLIAALTLTIERFKLFTDPGYTPSCSLNPVLSCGSVMKTAQAAFFGFPNPILGIGAFSVVVVTGVLAVARVPLPRWYWGGLTVGLLVGMVFIHYLIIESLYRINALCPYCMVVWAITPALLVVAARRWAALSGRRGLVDAAGWLWPVLIIWYVVLILLIAERFWSYWSTLL
nr:vitamin K epoxide reductase family protein [Williamsia sterculiae]